MCCPEHEHEVAQHAWMFICRTSHHRCEPKASEYESCMVSHCSDGVQFAIRILRWDRAGIPVPRFNTLTFQTSKVWGENLEWLQDSQQNKLRLSSCQAWPELQQMAGKLGPAFFNKSSCGTFARDLMTWSHIGSYDLAWPGSW